MLTFAEFTGKAVFAGVARAPGVVGNHIMKILWQLSAAFGLTLLAACAPNTGTVAVNSGAKPADQAALDAAPAAATELARDFEALAFGRATGGSLRRMQAPLTITATMPEDADVRGLASIIEATTTEIEARGGVRVIPTRLDADGAPVFGPEQRGVYALFTDRATLAEMVGSGSLGKAAVSSGCGSMSISGRGGEPYGAIILIDMSLSSAAQSYCLNREMVGNMGLPGYLPRTDSIFSDTTQVPNLSARDHALVRMLYDPRLRPGMTAAQARPLLPAIAADALAR